MDVTTLHWIISIIALILGILSSIFGIYFQYLKKGKLSCHLERHLNPAINVDLDKEICEIGITAIFENNQKTDWIITSLYLEYRLLNEYGTYSDPWQLLKDEHIRVPAKQKLARNYEIALPLENLEFWLNPFPPSKSKAKSNSEVSIPCTHIIPFWSPFFESEDELKNLLKYVEEKCSYKNKKLCLELIKHQIIVKGLDIKINIKK